MARERLKKKTMNALPAGRAQQGFAFVAALMVMLVVSILIAGVLAMSASSQQLATSRQEFTQALYVAESGVNALLSQWRANGVSNPPGQPYTGQATLSGGSSVGQYSVTWTAPDANGIVTATSVGTVNSSLPGTIYNLARTVKVDLDLGTGPGSNHQQNLVFDAALFSNTDLSMNGNLHITGSTFSNGNTSMNGNASVSGDVGSVGTVTTNGNAYIAGRRNPGATAIPMPTIDTAYYQSIATQIFSAGTSLNGNTALNGVVYINGNCSINGNFSGTGVIVATGTVTINGNAGLVNPNGGDAFAIIAGGGVKINGNSSIQGWIYTHSANISSPDSFSGNGNATIVGGIAADVIKVNGNLNVTYQKPSSGLDLPGSTGLIQPTPRSWQEIGL
jgi:cytoskeletal protein CcmA (bactofilin family)/Tfp pilus assembly protein PilV